MSTPVPLGPWYPPPPPLPRRRRGVRIGVLLGVLGVLALAGLAAVALVAVTASPGVPRAGECLHITRDEPGDGAFEKVGCARPSAVYRVDRAAQRGQNCRGGDYVEFAFYDRGDGRQQITLCLALNVADGECLTGIDDETAIAKVACVDPAAVERVQVRPGAVADCADAEYVFRYPEPARTVCLIRLPPRQYV